MSFSSNLPSFDVTRLLDRPLKAIDEEAVRDYFLGKTVLVSGAGGSIGSEICMQVARFGARKLIMVEACEFNLYQIDLKIRESGIAADSGIEIQSILVSATDRTAIRRIFKRHRPDTVLHAAAFKQVAVFEHTTGAAAAFGTLPAVGTKRLAVQRRQAADDARLQGGQIFANSGDIKGEVLWSHAVYSCGYG